MHIYLMRHGIADYSSKSADEALSSIGKKGVLETAEYMISENIRFDVIISSPMLRAAQTAKIVAEVLDYPIENIIKTDCITPDATPSEAMRFLAQYKDKQSILAVGHLPSMPRLAAALIGMSSTHPFPNAVLYRIAVDTIPPGSAELVRLYSPE